MRAVLLTLLLFVFIVGSQELSESSYTETVENIGEPTETASDTTDTMKTYIGRELVVVEERFIASPALKYAQSASISDSTIVENHIDSFQRLFETDCGIYVKQGQIPGTVPTPMIQNGDLTHQLYLLDGLAVSFPQLGLFDANYQSLWAIGNVEVIPGSHSALYGSGGMAGTINIRTPTDFRYGAFSRVEIAQGDHNYDWLAVRMNHQLFSRIGIHLSGTRLTADGETSAEGTRRENISAKIAIALADEWNIESYAQSHEGWLDYLWSGTMTHQYDDFIIGALHINGTLGKISTRTSLQLERYDQEYRTDFGQSRHSADVITGDIRATTKFGFLKSSLLCQMRMYDLSSTSSGEHKPTSFAAGAQAEVELNKISGLLSARLDRDIAKNSIPSIGIGARYDFNNGAFTTLSAGIGFRSPTPNELWWRNVDFIAYNPVIDSLGDTTGYEPSVAYAGRGNENLRIEQSTSFSITAGYEGKIIGGSVSGFFTSYKDLIQWAGSEYLSYDDAVDTSFYFPENIGAAKIAGVSIKCKAKPFDWLSTALSYTFTSAKDSSGEKLLERPQQFLSASVGLRYSIWEDKMSFNLRAEPMFIDGISHSQLNMTTWQTEIIDTTIGFLLGGSASVKYLDFELFATVQNLTDNRFLLPDGKESLGRWIKFGISWDFTD